MTNSQAAAHESWLVRGSPRAPGFSCEQSASIPPILQEPADVTCTQPRDLPPPSFLHANFMAKEEYIWHFRGIKPGLLRWEFDVTTTMVHIKGVLQISQIF